MRDIVLILIVAGAALSALRFGWVGVLLWTWVSLMNPHRYTYGFAYDAPLAAVAALAAFAGLLTAKERVSPLQGAPAVFFLLFNVWITISWLMGLDPSDDYEQWKKVMKINVMIFVALSLLISKKHIVAFAWVCALSLGLLGAKGGIFTLVNGGSYKVWGPPGTFIEDNNEFALALVMTIPLLRFLQLQLQNKWGSRLLLLMMLLLAASALGSHSRGGLLAISAMTLFLWWRGQNRLRNGLFLAIFAVCLVAFMPEEWGTRMETIGTYQEDNSAMGRLSAWGMAWNMAFHKPLGVGFLAARPELFLAYGPYGLDFGTPAAHSIYFQVLGHHGFIGLFLYLGLWISTFVMCGRIRRQARNLPQAKWCYDLASMAQVSLVGFGVGGAFLSLAYFDQTYNVMVLVVATHAWLRGKRWTIEPASQAGRWVLPGLNGPAVTARAAG